MLAIWGTSINDWISLLSNAFTQYLYPLLQTCWCWMITNVITYLVTPELNALIAVLPTSVLKSGAISSIASYYTMVDTWAPLSEGLILLNAYAIYATVVFLAKIIIHLF